MTTTPADTRHPGPSLMNSPAYRPNGGPHGVLGAVGPRVLGRETPDTARGVVSAETEPDKLESPVTWMHWATHQLERVASAHGCVNRDYRAKLIRDVMAIASDDDCTFDLAYMSDLLIRQVQANKEGAKMDAQQQSLPEPTKPPPTKATGPHWSADPDKVAAINERLKAQDIDIDFARDAAGLKPGEPLSAFRGSGNDFYRAAEAAHKVAMLKRAKELDEMLGPETPPEPPAQKPAEKAPQSDATPAPATVPPETRNDAPTDVVAPALSKITTLTGISAADISKRMNGRFPAAAYEPIPYGPMKGKTDLSFDYVRDRFDEVFGPHGLGWKMEPHAVMGKVEHIEVEEQRKDGGTRRVHMVAMEMFVFKYRVVMPNGDIEWIESSPLSDCDDNEDRGYAYRGAWTSLLKQTLRSFGGINHILRNEYTHVQAQQQGRRAA